MEFADFVKTADASLQPILNSCLAKHYELVFDKLNHLGWPEAVDVSKVVDTSDNRNKRAVGKWMEAFGYVRHDCPTTKDGRWGINGERVVLYRKVAPPLPSPQP